ncbi:site-2 protease family protein [Methylomonas rapida]|uniref:Site-2 protease family protein n=1 Tax=Methylomonas rapida TaxID=2963939 RepID=A0ABY7GPZ4_9GAMM|nr:site-2 protease family protein [Methylomonas rapida]WAR46566.1 site-2 protease family protein [Methylomonas rapida]
MMGDLTLVQLFVVILVPLVLAVTVHEVAHCWMAKLFGDNTAEQQGRYTLNPLMHIDLLGTIVVPGILLYFTGFIIGWAKPVPIDSRNFKKPKEAMMLVALAGPFSNILMAFGWAFLGRFAVEISQIEFVADPLNLWSRAGIHFNLILALINLLPIPPLDGSRVISGLLPDYWAWRYNQLERFGLIIMVILLLTGMLNILFDYPIYYLEQWFVGLAGR